MRKILLVARREYLAAVRTKAFLIGLLSMPIMMFGSIIVQSMLKDQVDLREKHYAVVDRTPGGTVASFLESAAKQRNSTQVYDAKTKAQTSPKFLIENVPPSATTPEAMAEQRFDLSERVRKKEIVGFLEVGPDALKAPEGALLNFDSKGRRLKPPEDREALRYQTETPLDDDFPNWATTTVSGLAATQRTAAAKVSLKTLMDSIIPVPLVTKKLSRKDPASGKISDASEESRLATFLAPAGLSILMFMMILVGTTPLMQSVFEEKTNRIAEVLLGSLRPFELMMGKLLGMVGVSLTTTALYLGGAYWAAHKYGFSEYLPPWLIAWFLIYQTLGVLMYGSVFIAIGAACSDIKETQSLTMPVMLVAMIPMFTLVNLIEHPSSPLSTGLSFFPFATPQVMLIRQSIPPGIPWWQPVVGILGTLAMTAACVYAAGRVFRVGLLMQGKGANFAQMAKWVFRG
ncbi:MAG TPA: ABC transporter permease [Isosphaeraceae bacterium]